MKRFNKNILLTVAAVITSFATPSFGRTVYESKVTGNWSSSTVGNSGFRFTEVTKGGPNSATPPARFLQIGDFLKTHPT